MRSKQRGVFLIGATIAVAVVGLLIAFWGRHQMQQMRIEKGERVGEALKVLGNHVQDFMVLHHGEIKKLFRGNESGISLTAADGTNVALTAGSNGPLQAKTIRDLTPEKLIRITGAKGIGESPPLPDAQYQIVVYSTNCVRASDACDINSVTYLTNPIKSAYSTDIDWTASGAALTKLGVLGGISHTQAPDTLRFLDGNGTVLNTIANPAQPAIAGLLAVRGGYQTSAQDAFLRRDGTRKMTGDLDMDTKRIVGAGHIAGDEIVATSVSASKRLVAGFSGRKAGDADDILVKSMPGGVIAQGDVYAGQNVTAKGNVISESGSVIAKSGEVRAGGAVVAGGEVTANGARIAGTLSVTGSHANVTLPEGVTIDSRGGAMGLSADLWAYGDVWAREKLWSEAGVIRLDGTVGGPCKELPNGRGIGLSKDGRVMSCQGGVWQLGSLPKDSSEVPGDIKDKIEEGARVGYAKWDVVSGVFNSGKHGKNFNANCNSRGTIEIKSGFACQLEVEKSYCNYPPRLLRKDAWTYGNSVSEYTYEIAKAGAGSGGPESGRYRITCLTPKGAGVGYRMNGGGTHANGNTGSNAGSLATLGDGWVRAANEQELDRLIPHSRHPELLANVTIEKFRCWIGDGGDTYNLDLEPDGPWDYCEMAPDERKYHCDQPNQRRDLYRDANTGAWMMRLKQRSAGARCVKFAR
ncbi:hypothetical protein [Pandoraea sp. PE-S2R-1]|uniref:hypothetical protein n=1 Tax=Pandoraea sp. PE-S2R-1 TaxID=1986994 RepID=UPI000B3FEC0F|nr:hypothetical protein [Pandoraea sp. PE-S2R-1]